MSTTAESLLADRIITALRSTSVAAAAGISSGVWSDTTATRVFRGISQMVGGRNRGRLPFIEYDLATRFDLESREGGTSQHTITLRAHVGGADVDGAARLTALILSASLASIRSETTDNLTAAGESDSIGAISQGPWGHTRAAEMTVDQSYQRSIYEVQ